MKTSHATTRHLMKGAALGALLAAAGLAAPASAQDSVYFANNAYRTGPFAAGGIPYADGFMDYFTLLNERDGGIGYDNEMLAVIPVRPYAREGGDEHHRQKRRAGEQCHDDAGLGFQRDLPGDRVLHQHGAEHRQELAGDE